jgi:hypothetical protein
MLQRALRLRDPLTAFLHASSDKDLENLHLTPSEWRHIEYLIELTHPFFSFTQGLSESSGPTIHKAFQIYNSIFDHLEDYITKLERKRIPWKVQLRNALIAAKEKLQKYYQQTSTIQGYVFAIATILSPAIKLTIFSQPEWQDSEDWEAKYRQAFIEVYKYYHTSYPSIKIRARHSTTGSRIDKVISAHSKRRRLNSSVSGPIFEEIEEYLKEGRLSITYAVLSRILLILFYRTFIF